MALVDTLQQSFGANGFDLGQAVQQLTGAFAGVEPDHVDVDEAGIGAIARRIGEADPGGTLGAVLTLTGRYGELAGSLTGSGNLTGPFNQIVDAVGSLGSGVDGMRATIVDTLRTPPAGDRPVDRFVAGAGALAGLRAGPLVAALRLLAAGAVPSLPASLTGALPALLGQAGGAAALADQLDVLASAATVPDRLGTLAELLGALADPAALSAATSAALAVDGDAIAARVASGDPAEEVAADVTAGLAPVHAYVDEVSRLLVGGLAALQVLNPVALETLLRDAVEAAPGAEPEPLRALASTVATLLDPVLGLRPTAGAAASVDAFGDLLAARLADVTGAVHGLDTGLVTQPVQDALDRVLAPVHAAGTALHDAIQAVRSALEAARSAVQSVGIDAIAGAVHTVLDPVVQAVEELRALLEPIAETVGLVATQTSAAIAQLRQQVEETAGQVTAAFTKVSDAVTGLHLDTELAALRSGMDEIAQTIEGISLDEAVDATVGLISGAAQVIEALPLDLLPDSALTEVRSVVAPVKALEFGEEVRDPFTSAVEEALGAIEGDFLDEVSAAGRVVLDFLADIDPTPALQEVEREGFDPFLERVRAIDPDEIMAPVRDALSGLGDLKRFLEPADAAFDQVLDAVTALDPVPLLTPIADELDTAREELAATLHLDQWIPQVDTACDRVLDSVDLIKVANVLDGAVALLDELWPEPASPRAGVPGANLLRRLLGTAAGTLDAGAFGIAGRWISGAEAAAAQIQAALTRVDGVVSAYRDVIASTNPGAVAATVTPQVAKVAAAVAALPAGALRERLAPLVATSPAELLAPAIAARGELLGRLQAVHGMLGRLATVPAAALDGLAGELRTALAPLSDALRSLARSWVARAGADPAGDLRAALREVLVTLADKLRPQAAAFDAAVAAKLHATVEGAVRAPVRAAATEVAILVAGLDLRPLLGEVAALFATVHQAVAALRPSTVLADLLTAIDDLLGDTPAWDPFHDARPAIEQMKSDVAAVTNELRPTVLLAPVITTYGTVVATLGALDVRALFDRTLTALHEFSDEMAEGLASAESAFVELQAALP